MFVCFVSTELKTRKLDKRLLIPTISFPEEVSYTHCVVFRRIFFFNSKEYSEPVMQTLEIEANAGPQCKLRRLCCSIS